MSAPSPPHPPPHPADVALPSLPITEVLPELVETLTAIDQLVLEAPPGAGKTTLVPLALLHQPWLSGKIIMLEPRRVAARAAAERMAALLGETVGQTVGYRVRQEVRSTAATRIEVITGGIFTRWLQDDPALDGVSLVIFDEFHERHLDSDLGLALCLQGRALFREENPLKLLVMSATLNGEAVAKLLDDAPVLSSKGKSYPVDVVYGKAQELANSIVDATAETVLRALQSEEGNILVFLPGQAEIHQVARSLANAIPNDVEVLPLYGGLSLEEQRRAIAPPPPGRRKVVLATNVAESSLTIEGVRVVVDSGRSREPAFDPRSGMTRLTTRRVSQASSTQRCGRAGRLSPGRCFRLWSEAQQNQLPPFAAPEILQADLSPLALQILAWGTTDPMELPWLDPPPAAAYQQGLDLLSRLGAVEPSPAGSWQLTRHGEHMSHFPAHPRLAHLLLRARERGVTEKGAQIAAVLAEPPRFQGADLFYPLAILTGNQPCPAPLRSWRERTLKQSRTFVRIAEQAQVDRCPALAPDDAVGYLVACAYPDRIAKRRGEQHGLYQLSNGRSARLAEGDPLINVSWLACAEVGGFAGHQEDPIQLAAALNPALFDGPLSEMVQQEDVLQWDTATDKLVAERRWQVGPIILNRAPLRSPPQEARQAALVELLRREGLELLPWTEALRQWQARVVLLNQLTIEDSDANWPDLSDEWLLDNLESWLTPYLNNITRLADLKALDLNGILAAQLPWPLPQQLEEMAPTAITVPSGSRVRIDYRERPPVVAVKLQEMFGCESTPTIARGKVPLVVHLLSPARRPLQITQDLAGFWRTSYQEVKKEMKGRYPKHPWPDDPLVAQPTRQVKHPKPKKR